MCLFYIFIYSYAGSEKLYAGSEKLYAGSEKLVRLLFFLRPSGSSPLFVCLLLCDLVRFVVLGVPQLQVIFVPLHLRPQTLLRQPSLALDTLDLRRCQLNLRRSLALDTLDLRRSLALDTLDLPLVEVMDGHGGKASDP
jgi:hypothetical protein